ncbi:MAG: NADAR family protein [Burkholderiales bacterium]|nr:NADAR family protein [Burkholderiales bacterium]
MTQTKTKIELTEVRFYRASEKPYGAFSNLYRREIEFEGEKFATSEHAYQAGKARKPEVRKWLMEAPSPALLAMAAHGLYVWDINSDWSRIKFDRMKRVLHAKYTQHEDLKQLLLSTGTARLVESATVDNAVNRLWGEVGGVGKNKLGELLMEVRAELAATAAAAKIKSKTEPKVAIRSSAAKPKTTAGDTPRTKRRPTAESLSA